MENSSKKVRNPYADIIRGFAIFLVVLGHCIQEGSGLSFRTNQSYWSDEFYQFIYSFHMPLFMILSGYFAYSSIHCAKINFEEIKYISGTSKALQSLLPVWLKRSFSLLFPILFWTLEERIRIYLINAWHGYPNPDFKTNLLTTFLSFAGNLWFLWVLWFCYTVTLVMHVIFHDSIKLYILGFLLFFVTWDGLWLGNAKFLFPFYLLAFYTNPWIAKWNTEKNLPNIASSTDNTLIIKSLPAVFLGSGLLYGVLLLFYNESSFIYLTGYKLLEKNALTQLGIDFYRFFIGLSGCIFFLLLWYIISQKIRYSFLLLRFFGRNSLGIYILSGYAIILKVQPLADSLQPSYFINILETLAVILVCSLLSMLLSKIPILRKTIGR